MHPDVVKNHNVSPVVHMDIQLIIVCHFVRRVAFIRRKTFIVVTTVNHSEDKEPVIYWGGDINILAAELQDVRHIFFGIDTALISVIRYLIMDGRNGLD